MAKPQKSISCPVESTLHVIGGKWKVLVIYQLLGNTRRFNELHRLLRSVSPRTLAKQLRQLEHDGVVRRKVYPEIPPHVEYSLTPLGKSLEPILMAMDKWAEAFSHRVPTRED